LGKRLKEEAMIHSKALTWTGRVLSGLVVLFLAMDGGMKVARVPVTITTTEQLGYPGGVAFGLGVLLLAIALLYALPWTSGFGAILLTGYLGGAVATHLRVGNPLFSHELFGVYIGVIAWAGLWLRDPRLRALIPLSRG
jgi:hypothetical protein